MSTHQWQVGDALKFKDEKGEYTGIVISILGKQAIVRWDDGFRDSGVNLENCEVLA